MATKVVVVVWGSAILYAGILHHHRSTVNANQEMLSECLERNDSSVGVIAPASTVAATAIVAVGIMAPTANAFAAATAVLLALDNAYADPIIGDVAAGFVAALPGVVALTVLADEQLGNAGTGASMALAAAAVYLSVEQSIASLVAVLSAVPIVVLLVRRLDQEEAIAASLLCIVAAGAARGAVNRMDGVCDNDTTAFERRDYATGLAYVLGTLALITIVQAQNTPMHVAMLSSAVLVLAWSVTNATTNWFTISIVVSVTLLVGVLYRVESVPPETTLKPRAVIPRRAIYKPPPKPVNWM